MIGTASSRWSTQARDLATTLGGAWLVFGLFLDGWAHLNVGGTDGFFTPWHAVLYSGFGALAVWTAAVVWWSRAPGGSLLRAVPDGYRGTVAGVAVFGVGGALDFAWHMVFGVEVGIDALISPSHLVLAAGGALILSTGVRADRHRRAASEQWTFTALVSVALTTALAAFFLIYSSAFAGSAAALELNLVPEGAPGHLESELPVIAGVSGYVITTVLLAVPLLFILGSAARPRLGMITVLVGSVAWLSIAVVGMPAAAVGGAVGATVAAALADAAMMLVPRTPRTAWLPVQVGGTVALVWTGHLLGLAAADAVRWPVTLVTGAVMLSTLLAAAIAVVTQPGARRDASGTAIADPTVVGTRGAPGSPADPALRP